VYANTQCIIMCPGYTRHLIHFYSGITYCLEQQLHHSVLHLVQGVYKSNQTNLQEISRRHFNKTITPEITSILFTRWTLPNISWQLLGTDANPEIGDTCLPSKHNHCKKYTSSSLPSSKQLDWSYILWLDSYIVVPSVKISTRTN